MDSAVGREFLESLIYAVAGGCDFRSLDCSETMLYSPSFVFLWTRPFKIVTTARYGAIGASRKAEVVWGQLPTQIRVNTEIPNMILD